MNRRRDRAVPPMPPMPPWPMEASRITNCLLREDIELRALSGDQAAVEALARMAPRDVPARERVRQRDATLRRLRDRLMLGRLTMSKRCVAKLLARAGQHCQSRTDRLPSDRAPFNELTEVERKWLEAECRKLLLWLGTWPKETRTRQILATGQG
jgi:hypothetical protein